MKLKRGIIDALRGLLSVSCIIAGSIYFYHRDRERNSFEYKLAHTDTTRINFLFDEIRRLEEIKPVSDSVAEIIFNLADNGIELTKKPYTYSGYPCLWFQDKRARYAYQLGYRKAAKYTDWLITNTQRFPTFFSKPHLWMPDKGGRVKGYHLEFFGDPMFLRYKELLAAGKYKKAKRVLDLLSSVTTDDPFNRENPYEHISDTLVVQNINLEDILGYARYDLASISENARLRYLMGDKDAYKWMQGAYTTGALYLSPYEGILATYDEYENKASEFFRQLTPYMIANYNNEDPAWVYNTALLVKGSSAVMPKAVRDGSFQDDIFQTYLDIQGRLNEGECAIEIVKVPSFKGEDVYKAVLLTSKGQRPVMVVLCKASVLNDAVSNGKAYSEDGTMYKLVWKPIEQHLNGKKKVYIAADGVLCLVNIGAIQDDKGGTVADKYNISNCISTKDIGRHHESSNSKDVVFFGGLTYSPEVAKDNEWFAGFEYLPGTLEEVNAVAEMAKGEGYNTALYTESAGTKAAFELLDGKTLKVLHIATHGFYYTQQRAKNITFFDQMADDNDPLNRCGLLLSDGPILGSDIARMDFSGVDVVILSACNTGLGDVTSEGVAGLQKAFRQAGVRNIVMSLEAMNDDTSCETILSTYGNVLNKEDSQVTSGGIMLFIQ